MTALQADRMLCTTSAGDQPFLLNIISLLFLTLSVRFPSIFAQNDGHSDDSIDKPTTTKLNSWYL